MLHFLLLTLAFFSNSCHANEINKKLQDALKISYQKYSEQTDDDIIKNRITEKIKLVDHEKYCGPENPMIYGINTNYDISLMLQARLRLLRLLSNDFLETEKTNLLAHTQYLYDCWIMEYGTTEKSMQTAAKCMSGFFANINALEKILHKKNLSIANFDFKNHEYLDSDRLYQFINNKNKKRLKTSCMSLYFKDNDEIPVDKFKITLMRLANESPMEKINYVMITALHNNTKSGVDTAIKRYLNTQCVMEKTGIPRQKFRIILQKATQQNNINIIGYKEYQAAIDVCIILDDVAMPSGYIFDDNNERYKGYCDNLDYDKISQS